MAPTSWTDSSNKPITNTSSNWLSNFSSNFNLSSFVQSFWNLLNGGGGTPPVTTPGAPNPPNAPPTNGPKEPIVPVKAGHRIDIQGDPHVYEYDPTGKKIKDLTFQQEGIYHILKDKGVTLNADMKHVAGQPEGTTSIQSMGLKLGNTWYKFNDQGQVTDEHDKVLDDAALANGPIKRQGNAYNVNSEEYKMTFEHDKANKHWNVSATVGEKGISSDGVKPDGVAGDTLRDEQIKEDKQTSLTSDATTAL